ncbi:MAG: EF-Tu/IF-2/RF-3 family GTPase [Aggregatilineales bacterium]
MNSPKHNNDKPFLLAIEDVFSIKGRGTIVVGHVTRGTLLKGQEVDIIGFRNSILRKTVDGIEMFHKELQTIQTGDNAGILLRDTGRDEVLRGMVIAKVGSIKPHKKFKCEISMLRRDEGGRHKPFVSGYKPGFYIRTADIPGAITFPDGLESVSPGDTATVFVNLATPVALEHGTLFSIQEGNLKVGSGRVIRLLD